MTTTWTLPNAVDQYAETGGETAHISWINFSGLSSLDGRSTRTSKDLIHIAVDERHDLTNKTYFLKLTNFSFIKLPEVLSGIEVRISMNRGGRITDETVQLCINNNLIGDNQASLEMSPIKLYGSDTSKWNTQLTMNDIQNPTFGVVIRFQSHPRWPHKSSPLIDAVELRIH
jgi:hypothetical protein